MTLVVLRRLGLATGVGVLCGACAWLLQEVLLAVRSWVEAGILYSFDVSWGGVPTNVSMLLVGAAYFVGRLFLVAGTGAYGSLLAGVLVERLGQVSPAGRRAAMLASFLTAVVSLNAWAFVELRFSSPMAYASYVYHCGVLDLLQFLVAPVGFLCPTSLPRGSNAGDGSSAPGLRRVVGPGALVPPLGAGR